MPLDLTVQELKALIADDILRKSALRAGANYYAGKNDVLSKNFNEYKVEGKTVTAEGLANNQMVDNYTRLLVDQAVDYIDEITYSSDNKELMKAFKETVGKCLPDELAKLHTYARQQGFSGMSYSINADGEFEAVAIQGLEIIEVRDSRFQKKLKGIIRYYEFEVLNDYGTNHLIYRAEVIDEEKIVFYQQDEPEGDFRLMFVPDEAEANPQPHFITYAILDESDIEANTFGIIPMSILENNAYRYTDLRDIKKYVDALDIIASGFVNDLEDIKEVLYVINGFMGETPASAKMKLKELGVILTNAQSNQSVSTVNIPIPHEARTVLMSWLETKIWAVGRGVNMDKLTGGSLTNVLIKAYFANLSAKVKRTMKSMYKVLDELSQAVVAFINATQGTTYSSDDIKWKITYNQIFNDFEIVQMINMSKDTVSDKTLREVHPLVSDADEEEKRIEEQQKANSAMFNIETPVVDEGGTTDE